MTQSGTTMTTVGKIDLGPDIPEYEMDIRLLVLPHGASNSMHSHAHRPGFAYILRGTLTENRADDVIAEYGPGAMLAEPRDVTHFVVNHGLNPVELLAVHINRKR